MKTLNVYPLPVSTNWSNLLIELRTNAKKAKDFAAADLIRNGLKDCGVTLEDSPGGTEWSVVR